MENDVKKSDEIEECSVLAARKHSLSQLKLPNKTNVFCDKNTPKTPTPTRTVDRLLKNCDDFGLFEELKHVNPFDETFRKAIESKDTNLLSTKYPLKEIKEGEDLNTPQYPVITNKLSSEKSETNEECMQDIASDSTVGVQQGFKRRSLLNTRNESKKGLRKILPKPSHVNSIPVSVAGTTKGKLKAFILKDSLISPIENKVSQKEVKEIKSPQAKSVVKSTVNKSYKVPESNREAAKRYRKRVKQIQQHLEEENQKLKHENTALRKENIELKRQMRRLFTSQIKVQQTPQTSTSKIITNSQLPDEQSIDDLQQVYIVFPLPPTPNVATTTSTSSNSDKQL